MVCILLTAICFLPSAMLSKIVQLTVFSLEGKQLNLPFVRPKIKRKSCYGSSYISRVREKCAAGLSVTFRLSPLHREFPVNV